MTLPPISRRVVKIGGSLLTLRDLPERLETWIDQNPAETIAIIGGGDLVNAMRQLDAIHAMGAERVHWQCVDLLQITFDWFASRIPHWKIVTTQDSFASIFEYDRIDQTSTKSRYLVSVQCFYGPDCGTNGCGRETPKLPTNWATTTDSIAGLLAVRLHADELVLCKSCSVDASRSLAELAKEGIVDEALPTLVDQIPPIRFVNLRETDPH